MDDNTKINTMQFKKPWKIRNLSDLNYSRLGNTPDDRRNRADNIEIQISNNWKWLLTTIIAIIASPEFTKLNFVRKSG